MYSIFKWLENRESLYVASRGKLQQAAELLLSMHDSPQVEKRANTVAHKRVYERRNSNPVPLFGRPCERVSPQLHLKRDFGRQEVQ
jgi:hypothetical protein